MDQYPHISPEELELIEQYHTGQLNETERSAFEARLKSDETLRQQTEEIKLLITGIREVALEEKLSQFHEEVAAAPKEPALPRVGGMKRWLVAASIIALVGIGVWFALSQRVNDDSLYATYYEKDPGLLSAMSSVADNYEFDRAMIHYKEGKNEAAIKSWELQLKDAPDNDTLQYFLGSAYLASENTPKAIAYFSKVISNSKSEFHPEACWYAGLAYLREGKKQEAISLLRQSDRKEKEELIASLKN